MYECTVKIIDGAKHFFVAFNDINCHTQTIEVSKELFLEFKAFQKEDEHQRYTFRRYIEHIDLTDEELHFKAFNSLNLTDEIVINKQLYSRLCEAIETLSHTQKRRFLLYYEYDLTFREIATIEGRAEYSVQESIYSAKAKVLRAIETFL